MSAQRPDTPSGGRADRSTARPADAAEPMAPGSQRQQSPAVRQQQAASDGSPRQPGSQDAHREQYGQQAPAGGSGQPSQFGGVPPQQHAGHAGHAGGGSDANRPRSGGTQDPRHAEEDDYAAPWGVYGGEYGQFDRSPGRRQAFGQQDLGFGRGPAQDSPRSGEQQAYGPGASQPWRGDEEGAHWRGRPGASDDSGGWGRGQPYAPGRYGASAAGGPQGDESDHDSQGSQDWQGYSGGRGWQPGPREGGPGQWDRQTGRSGHTPGGGPGRERSQHAGGAHGAWRGEAGGYGGGRHDTDYSRGAQPGRRPDTHGGPQQGERWTQGRMPAPQAEDTYWAPPGGNRGQPGADGGMPVRDPSHDWGTRDAEPWHARQQGHDDGDDRGGRHDPRWGGPSRSFDNPYGRRDERGDQPLGEHQGSSYAGRRRGGIGSRAGAASGGWDPSEHHGGHYGTQGFGGSGRGGPGWSTPPGAGQPEDPSGHASGHFSQHRPWDEPRSRQADSGPASWQAQSRGSGWRGEPGSGPSGDRDDEPDSHRAWQRHAGGAGWRGDEARGQGAPRHRQAHDDDQASAHHDPDYHQWRAEQLRNFDDDYHQWRQERYRRFSDEFNEWRQGRMRGAPSQASGSSGQASQPDDLPGFRPPSAGAGAGSASAAAGAGQPGSAHDVGVSGSTHAGSRSDPQGAAQGTTLPSSGGESRELTGTSGGTTGGAATTKGADRGPQGDKPGKAKER